MIFKNKQLCVLLMMSVLFYSQYSFAQVSNPLNTVDTFFEGFHKRDSIMIQSVVTADAQLFRTGNAKDGAPFRKVMTMERFIRSVTSRPEKPNLERTTGKAYPTSRPKLSSSMDSFSLLLRSKTSTLWV
jgi:hypothetical protein